MTETTITLTLRAGGEQTEVRTVVPEGQTVTAGLATAARRLFRALPPAPEPAEPPQQDEVLEAVLSALEFHLGEPEDENAKADRLFAAQGIMAALEIPIDVPFWEYGWAADSTATEWYDTESEAEEFIGRPLKHRRRAAGEWTIA